MLWCLNNGITVQFDLGTIFIPELILLKHIFSTMTDNLLCRVNLTLDWGIHERKMAAFLCSSIQRVSWVKLISHLSDIFRTIIFNGIYIIWCIFKLRVVDELLFGIVSIVSITHVVTTIILVFVFRHDPHHLTRE